MHPACHFKAEAARSLTALLLTRSCPVLHCYKDLAFSLVGPVVHVPCMPSIVGPGHSWAADRARLLLDTCTPLMATPDPEKAFAALLKSCPSVANADRDRIFRESECTLHSSKLQRGEHARMHFANDSILISVSDGKQIKLHQCFRLNECKLDPMLPCCKRICLSAPSGATALVGLSSLSLKAEWVDDLHAAILGATSPEDQLSPLWAHDRILGSLHAAAFHGRGRRVRRLCHWLSFGSSVVDSGPGDGDDEDDDDDNNDGDNISDCDSCAGRSYSCGSDSYLPPSIDIDGVDEAGYTPLHLAAMQGHTNCVGILLQNAASLHSLDGDCNTPLHLAVLHRHVATTAFLLANGAPMDSRNLLDNTPLHLALGQRPCTQETAEIVTLLAGHGASAAEADSEGLTPFHLLSLARPSRSSRPSVGSESDRGPAGRASKQGSSPVERIAAALVKAAGDASTFAGLSICSLAEDKEDTPVDPVTLGVTPLHLACGLYTVNDPRGDEDKEDAEEGIPPSARVDIDALKALLSAGAQPNSRVRGERVTGEPSVNSPLLAVGSTPLHIILRLMLAAKKASSSVEPTPEQLAHTGGMHPSALCAQMYLAAGHVLVSHGARLDITDGHGHTCAMLADILGIRHALEASSGMYKTLVSSADAAAHVAGLLSERSFNASLMDPSSAAAGHGPARGGGVQRPNRAPSPTQPVGSLASFMGKLSLAGGKESGPVCCMCAHNRAQAAQPHLACAWCRATPLCTACAAHTFPIPDSGGSAAENNTSTARTGLASMGKLLSSALQASVPPSSHPGTMAATAHGASHAGFAAAPIPIATLTAHPSATKVSPSTVCDGCFNLLRSQVEHRARERAVFEAQAAQHAAAARNMRDSDASAVSAERTQAAIAAARARNQAGPSAQNAERSALFGTSAARNGSAGGTGSSGSVGSQGHMAGVGAAMERNREAMAQRGEKISRLAQVTGDMSEDARAFESAAKRLKDKYKSPLGLGFLGL